MLHEGGIPDRKNVESLFATHGDSLYRFALHSIGNPEDARDVVQEVFIRVQRSHHSFRGEAQMRTWLFQIAKNYITDCLRKKRRHDQMLYSIDADSRISYENMDTFLDLKRGIAHLKLAYRQVISLRFIEDLSIEDTARILQWSQGKVRTTQYRALQKLRNELGEDPIRIKEMERKMQSERQ